MVGCGARQMVPVTRNALTVDVEEYFQVAAFERTIPRASWEGTESRVELSTGRVLDVFAGHGAKATFFVLGWIAERYPALVRRIVAEGHELASHGYDHTRIHNFSRAQFREDVTRTKGILEDISGAQVRGYRAPSYSIDARNLWALDVLQETGHAYSSSIYPISHDLYGMPEAPRFPFHLRDDSILEIPVTTVRIGGRNYPCGGGGYFRLLPYSAFRWMLQASQRTGSAAGAVLFSSLGSRSGAATGEWCATAVAFQALPQSRPDAAETRAPAVGFQLGTDG